MKNKEKVGDMHINKNGSIWVTNSVTRKGWNTARGFKNIDLAEIYSVVVEIREDLKKIKKWQK